MARAKEVVAVVEREGEVEEEDEEACGERYDRARRAAMPCVDADGGAQKSARMRRGPNGG